MSKENSFESCLYYMYIGEHFKHREGIAYRKQKNSSTLLPLKHNDNQGTSVQVTEADLHGREHGGSRGGGVGSMGGRGVGSMLWVCNNMPGGSTWSNGCPPPSPPPPPPPQINSSCETMSVLGEPPSLCNIITIWGGGCII